MGGWAEQRGGGWAALSGEAVAVGSVKCDLAALLCHSGRSGVRGGRGADKRGSRDRKRKSRPQPADVTQTSDINIRASS